MQSNIGRWQKAVRKYKESLGMKKVNILMPTYNGEKYLRCQLDSILAQTYKNIDIYIRDDGSTDNTIQIIDEYCAKEYEGIRFIKVDSNGKNLGYPDCFWELVRSADDADYYSFGDQDDWWDPRKIELAVKSLEKVPEGKPAMTYCAFDYYDQNMKFIRKGDNYDGQLSFEKGMYYTFAPGFTQVVNRALIQTLDIDYIFGKGLAHDIWCQWIATSMGMIIPEKQILAKYRRHSSAVTSANASVAASVKRWLEKEILGDEMINWKRSLSCFTKEYYKNVKEQEKKTLQIFANNKKTMGIRLKKVFYRKRLRPTLGGEAALRVLFLIGKC